MIGAKQWNDDFSPCLFVLRKTYAAHDVQTTNQHGDVQLSGAGWVYDPRAQEAALSTLLVELSAVGLKRMMMVSCILFKVVD